MKRFKRFAVISLLVSATTMLCGCGSSKNTTPSNSEVKVELDECEVYANQKPGLRAAGVAVSNSISRATAFAELDARAKFARALEAHIKTAQDNAGLKYSKNSSDEQNAATVTDRDEKDIDINSSVAEKTVANTCIVKSSRYIRPDGSYRIFVCLEYKGEIADLANDVVNNVKQQVSDDDRLKMNYEFEKFRQFMEEELAKQKGQ